MKKSQGSMSLYLGASALVVLFIGAPAESKIEKVKIERPYVGLFSEVNVEKMTSSQNKGLVEIKKNYNERRWLPCFEKAERAKGQYRNIEGWIWLQQVECLRELAKSNRVYATKLFQLLTSLSNKNRLIYESSAASLLQKSYVFSILELIRMDVKDASERALRGIDNLLEQRALLDQDTLKQLYELTAQALAKQKQPEASRQFYRYAYDVKPSEDLRIKSSSDVPMPKSSCRDSSIAITQGMEQAATQLNSAEFNKGVQALREMGDLTCIDQLRSKTLAQLNVSLTQPDWTKAISFLNQSFRSEIAKVAESLYFKGYSDRALEILRHAAIGDEDSSDLRAKQQLIMGQVQLEQGNYKEAASAFLAAAKFNNENREESIFKAAVCEIRREKWSQAKENLNRLIGSNQKEMRLKSIYYLWRIAQSEEAKKDSEKWRELLISSSQDTIYGLAALADKQSGILKDQKTAKFPMVSSVEVWLNEDQKNRFDRFKVLARSGWWREAQEELKKFILPTGAEQVSLFLDIWFSVGAYSDAFVFLDREGVPSPLTYEWIKPLFPMEFKSLAAKEGEKVGLDGLFILSLIRQESAFSPFVQSSAKAMGLMQLLVPTAKEIAPQVGQKDFSELDLAIPEKNIPLGSLYISRLIKKYEGNVALGLASYNAGPGRVDRWLKKREDLRERIKKDQGFFQDLWIEEVPWKETQLYIRRILRNWVIYQTLDKGQYKWSDPVWQGIVVQKTQ